MLPIQPFITSTQTPVYFIHTPELPILELRIIFDAGSARDGNHPGIAELTHHLIREGTATLSEEQVAEQFDQVGAIFGTVNDQDMSIVSLRTLTTKNFLDPALTTLTALLHAPLFPTAGFLQQQKLQLAMLEHQAQSPGDIAENAFFELIYPNHPYQTPALGNKKSIQQLTASQASDFYQRYYTAQNARIVMVGDLTRKQAEKIAEKICQALPKGQRAAPLPLAKPTNQSKIKTIPYPASQTHILIGQVGIDRNDPHYFGLYVGNYILGGDPLVSQLGQAVREKKGLVYDIRSHFLPLQAKGPFLISFQTRQEKATLALTTAQKTLATFMNQPPTQSQLQSAKDHLIKGYPLHFDSNNALAGHLVDLAFYELPLDYFLTFTQKISAVTTDEIYTAFKNTLHPDKMVVVQVGKG